MPAKLYRLNDLAPTRTTNNQKQTENTLKIYTVLVILPVERPNANRYPYQKLRKFYFFKIYI